MALKVPLPCGTSSAITCVRVTREGPNMGQTGLAERGDERDVLEELRELRIPIAVRLLARSLRDLPKAAQALLQAAAAFTSSIDFEVVRRVSGLDEQAALDALD